MNEIQPWEVADIPVAHGHVSFAKSFQYLGTTITGDLREDTEIKTRISKASQSMGALRDFFRNKYVNLRTKFLIYLAIPINIALWGCESWALTQALTDRLSAFHHKSIRSILGINMHQVKEERIKNEKVREMFLGIRPIEDLIVERQLRWIGKMARMEDNRLPKQLMIAWCAHPRPRGRPQQTIRNCHVQAIQRILPTVSDNAHVSEWTHLAKEPQTWESLMANAGLRQTCVSR